MSVVYCVIKKPPDKTSIFKKTYMYVLQCTYLEMAWGTQLDPIIFSFLVKKVIQIIQNMALELFDHEG